MNERDVIPALGWKLARSSGKPSLWGSSRLSWSELHRLKTSGPSQPASWGRQNPPPSLPLILSPWCSRLSPHLLPKLRGGPLLPPLLLPILGLFGLSPDARMVGGASGCGGGQGKPAAKVSAAQSREGDPQESGGEMLDVTSLSGFGKGRLRVPSCRIRNTL